MTIFYVILKISVVDVELYGADNKVMGVLNCDITYDKVSYY